jgi:CDP-diacylglycerol--glycerol-3-phosphate 3-phosphatidyltransferase
MKSIANYISILRIFLAPALFFARPLSIEFFVIYFVCGISDIFDGYIARKMNTTSKLGEKLDSIADLIMVTVLIIILLPIINISIKILYLAISIALIRITSMIILFIKYKTLGILHTVGNKVTGFILFLFPLIIKSDVLIYLLCIIASVSAIEELFINLFSKELDRNRKGILKTSHLI